MLNWLIRKTSYKTKRIIIGLIMFYAFIDTITLIWLCLMLGRLNLSVGVMLFYNFFPGILLLIILTYIILTKILPYKKV